MRHIGVIPEISAVDLKFCRLELPAGISEEAIVDKPCL